MVEYATLYIKLNKNIHTEAGFSSLEGSFNFLLFTTELIGTCVLSEKIR